jgi:hypothetical protein
MTERDPLERVLDWFRDAGGDVAEELDEPREVHLLDSIFYVGEQELVPLVIEVSVLLSICDIDLVDDLTAEAPDGVSIEAGHSDLDDIWAAVRLRADDLRPEALPERLRSFVDYSLQTARQVQDRIHPLDVVKPDPDGGALAALRRLVGVDDLVARAEEMVSLATVNVMRRTSSSLETPAPARRRWRA